MLDQTEFPILNLGILESKSEKKRLQLECIYDSKHERDRCNLRQRIKQAYGLLRRTCGIMYTPQFSDWSRQSAIVGFSPFLASLQGSSFISLAT